MVTSENEIARRLQERDSARSARRARAATAVGELARRHTALAGQLADLERDLGKVLIEAGEVIDVLELAQVTDIPAADLSRWGEQATKPARSGKRKRPSVNKNHTGTVTPAATEAPSARPAPPAPPPEPETAGAGTAALGAASS